MGEAKRHANLEAESRRRAGMPSLEGAPRLSVARKLYRGADVDAERQVLVIRGRGPLDTSDVEVELPWTHLKHYCGQLIQQEAEALILAAGGKVIGPPG